VRGDTIPGDGGRGRGASRGRRVGHNRRVGLRVSGSSGGDRSAVHRVRDNEVLSDGNRREITQNARGELIEPDDALVSRGGQTGRKTAEWR